MHAVVDEEAEVKDIDLNAWVDPEMISKFSKLEITDRYIKELYQEFRSTVVLPPSPGSYTEYVIENGQDALLKSANLGQRIHNLGFALDGEAFEKYRDLLHIMRDVLYLDVKHIPLAIERDDSKAAYWHNLHNKWMGYVVEEYDKLFQNQGEGLKDGNSF